MYNRYEAKASFGLVSMIVKGMDSLSGVMEHYLRSKYGSLVNQMTQGVMRTVPNFNWMKKIGEILVVLCLVHLFAK